jgi:hypothetical protein
VITLAVAQVSFAALLGILVGFPVIAYNGTGTLSYAAGTTSFSLTASPISIRLSAITPARLINPTLPGPSEVVTVNIQVSNTGVLIGGSPGDDLSIVGEVDLDGDTVIDHAGVLLTGEISQFGFLDTGTTTDRYDMRFTLTGGLLASNFAGFDIGIAISSEGSTFVNDFTVDFGGGAKGNVGTLTRLNQPPLCVANGPYQAECAGAATSVQLDGSQSSDPDNDQLTYSWSTDCPNASFDNPTSATPILTVDTSAGLAVSCSVSLVVSDGVASSAPCTATIDVSDTNPPGITCPADISIDCAASTDPADTGSATGTDDCSSVTITHADVEAAGVCPVTRVITRTWTATDVAGNSVSCAQTISLSDTAPPVITCPPAKTVNCGQSTDPAATGSATATDNCDTSVTIEHSDAVLDACCPLIARITRTWTATDDCGNTATCCQIITIKDRSAPTIVCPPNKALECGQSKHPNNTGWATATDSCDDHPKISYCDSVCGTCPKVITRKWTATDDCGNHATCTQTITIDDTVPPTICCPPDKVLECGSSIDPCKTGRASAQDACDSCVSVTYCDTSTGSGCDKVISRVWSAKDDCNNVATCTQTIRFEEREKCPRSPGYWKNHRSDWPVNSLVVGGVTYNATQLHNLLSNKKPNGQSCSGDASVYLAKFVIATEFNLRDGSQPHGILDELQDAHEFLEDHPPGCNPRGNDKQCATRLMDKLDCYVNSNPPGCRDCN